MSFDSYLSAMQIVLAAFVAPASVVASIVSISRNWEGIRNLWLCFKKALKIRFRKVETELGIIIEDQNPTSVAEDVTTSSPSEIVIEMSSSKSALVPTSSALDTQISAIVASTLQSLVTSYSGKALSLTSTYSMVVAAKNQVEALVASSQSTPLSLTQEQAVVTTVITQILTTYQTQIDAYVSPAVVAVLQEALPILISEAFVVVGDVEEAASTCFPCFSTSSTSASSTTTTTATSSKLTVSHPLFLPNATPSSSTTSATVASSSSTAAASTSSTATAAIASIPAVQGVGSSGSIYIPI